MTTGLRETGIDCGWERIEADGVVQGVGFRPFVYRLATEIGLVGEVANDSASVVVTIGGTRSQRNEFVQRLTSQPPPLASIERITRRPITSGRPPASILPPNSASIPTSFSIVGSTVSDGGRTMVAPDSAQCRDCVREMFDPHNRRYRHPFISCTNCGPRFSIIRSLPYDRHATTMAAFAMCALCEAEYHDPVDRRFHAQPICCPDCGPQLEFFHSAAERSAAEPIGEAARMIRRGAVVAIKGLGGYHLACDATNDVAVADLRRRKLRPNKPLAVLVADLEIARRLARLSDAEADLLASPEGPIVLVSARGDGPGAEVSPRVTCGSPVIGLMLPYTPVHRLLMAATGRPLVLTSANYSGQPLIHDRAELVANCDLFDGCLDHDRPIESPCDDSVVRVVADRVLPIRRARGYAPVPIQLPAPVPEGGVLAVGGELKNTFCLADGRRAWVSQHLGDMENLSTLSAFEQTVQRYRTLYGLDPKAVVADAHPEYRSSAWARRSGLPITVEQHHRAHVASVLADAGAPVNAVVLGFAFDGTGFGDDGTIWGGEVLAGPVTELARIAHLEPVDLPGGDGAVRHPWRMALSWLRRSGITWEGTAPASHASDGELVTLENQLERRVSCVPTTSMGRLFDAVASLLDIRHDVHYEAQAAIELEELASSVQHSGGDPGCDGRYRFPVDGLAGVTNNRPGGDGPVQIRVTPVVADIMTDLKRGHSPAVIALRFHHAVANMVADVARAAVPETAAPETAVPEAGAHNPAAFKPDARSDAVALTGGVFQNRLLVELCVDALAPTGLSVLTHHRVPPNDGGLALGQAYLAAARHQQLLVAQEPVG